MPAVWWRAGALAGPRLQAARPGDTDLAVYQEGAQGAAAAGPPARLAAAAARLGVHLLSRPVVMDALLAGQLPLSDAPACHQQQPQSQPQNQLQQQPQAAQPQPQPEAPAAQRQLQPHEAQRQPQQPQEQELVLSPAVMQQPAQQQLPMWLRRQSTPAAGGGGCIEWAGAPLQAAAGAGAASPGAPQQLVSYGAFSLTGQPGGQGRQVVRLGEFVLLRPPPCDCPPGGCACLPGVARVEALWQEVPSDGRPRRLASFRRFYRPQASRGGRQGWGGGRAVGGGEWRLRRVSMNATAALQCQRMQGAAGLTIGGAGVWLLCRTRPSP